jgi:hypothetical protein
MSSDTLPIDISGISDPRGVLESIAKDIRCFVENALQKTESLNAGERHVIAAWTSSLNGCRRTANVHAKIARGELDPKRGAALDRLIEMADSGGFSRKMRALLEISKALQGSTLGLQTKHIKDARAAGACDQSIHDTVLITAAICMYNHYFDGLVNRKAYKDGDEPISPQAHTLRDQRSPAQPVEGLMRANRSSKHEHLVVDKKVLKVDSTGDAPHAGARPQYGKAKKLIPPGTLPLPATRQTRSAPQTTRPGPRDAPPALPASRPASKPVPPCPSAPVWRTPTTKVRYSPSAAAAPNAVPKPRPKKVTQTVDPSLSLTKHASERKRQRAITAEALEIVRQFGEEFRDRQTGADIYWLNDNAVKKHSAQIKQAIQKQRFQPQDFQRAHGLAIVTQGRNVVTQYRAKRPGPNWIPNGW